MLDAHALESIASVISRKLLASEQSDGQQVALLASQHSIAPPMPMVLPMLLLCTQCCSQQMPPATRQVATWPASRHPAASAPASPPGCRPTGQQPSGWRRRRPAPPWQLLLPLFETARTLRGTKWGRERVREEGEWKGEGGVIRI